MWWSYAMEGLLSMGPTPSSFMNVSSPGSILSCMTSPQHKGVWPHHKGGFNIRMSGLLKDGSAIWAQWSLKYPRVAKASYLPQALRAKAGACPSVLSALGAKKCLIPPAPPPYCLQYTFPSIVRILTRTIGTTLEVFFSIQNSWKMYQWWDDGTMEKLNGGMLAGNG